MSKAVLVLPDMPGGCVECTLARMNADGEMICAATEKEANFIIGVDKPGSCPLRPMPERVYYGKDCSEWDDGYQSGVAAALRAIEGSEEDG